jgi:N-acetylneuraminate synthase/N,N'-diacetyllegionaminate synthase
VNKTIQIGTYKIGENHPCFIVGEIGMNHDGSKEKAKELIQMAAEAGVQAVKFQTFRALDIINPTLSADYDKDEPVPDHFKFFYEYIAQFELRYEWHDELIAFARDKGLIFISTPCSFEAIDFLASRIPAFKVASMDLNNLPLLRKMGSQQKPVILSTGIGTFSEIEDAFYALKEGGAENICILHCVSNYPAKPDELNLRNITTLKEVFEVPVGFSDHSTGIAISIAAVALGANIIEKHITMSRETPGPDHYFAMEPRDLRDLVAGIREVELSLGRSSRILDQKEKEKAYTYRRSILVRRDMKQGEIIKATDLEIIRPGSGIPPVQIDNVVGMELKEDVCAYTPLQWDHFKS